MSSQTRSAETLGVTRRTALGLGLGAAAIVAAGGCAADGPQHTERTPAARAVRDLEPDVAVAVEAATALHGAEAAVAATGERHAGLAQKLAGLSATHRAHLARVVDAVPDGVDTSGSAPAYVVPARPAAALTRLRGVETSLHDTLVGLAMRAQSGAFARLLGSMAAATSQQLRGLAP